MELQSRKKFSSRQQEDISDDLAPLRSLGPAYVQEALFQVQATDIVVKKDRLPAGIVQYGKRKGQIWSLDTSEAFRAIFIGITRCLHKETLVEVPGGIKPISELKTGDYIYGRHQRSGWKAKVKCFPYPPKAVEKFLLIKLDDGSEIRCSKEHEIYLSDGSKLEAKALQVGDDLYKRDPSYGGKKLCVFCGESFEAANYNRKCCSSLCAKRYSNKISAAKTALPRRSFSFACKNCSCEVLTEQRMLKTGFWLEPTKHFCSFSCRTRYYNMTLGLYKRGGKAAGIALKLAKTGKTYEEIYGAERAAIIKSKLAITMRKRFLEGFNPVWTKHFDKEAWRKKISAGITGSRNPFYGKKHAIHPRGMLGKKHREESKWKTSRSVSRGIQDRRIFRRETAPERKMAEILSELGYLFVSQHAVDIGHYSTVADFYLPGGPTIIEVDGLFWHKYPFGTDKDRYKTMKLRELGYKVLRFWEGKFSTESVKLALEETQ